VKRLAVSLALFGVAIAAAAHAEPAARRIEIQVTADGYKPSTMHAKPGEKLVLVFKRIGSAGCGNTVVVPAANFRADLVEGKPVEVAVTMPKLGKLTFACPMDMYQGEILPP
jgi:plastocyanin domain-containing protein